MTTDPILTCSATRATCSSNGGGFFEALAKVTMVGGTDLGVEDREGREGEKLGMRFWRRGEASCRVLDAGGRIGLREPGLLGMETNDVDEGTTVPVE